MITTTHKIRTEIERRLLADSTCNIGKVLNPDEARNPAHRPAAGRRYAVLWTLEGSLENQRADKLQWRQAFAVDVAVEWGADPEQTLDAIRIALASVMAQPFAGLAVQRQQLQDITIGYPAEGSKFAVVSGTAEFTYVEQLTTS